MRIKQSSLIFLSFILIQIISPGICYSHEYQFREIPIELVRQAQHKLEPEAEAAIVYYHSELYFPAGSYSRTLSVHQRIKIFKRTGFRWADFTIPHTYGGVLAKIEAYTYNLVDGQIIEKALPKNQVFQEEFNKVYKRQKFAMPNVNEGAVLDIHYVIKNINYTDFDLFLQYEIPVDEIVYEIENMENIRSSYTIDGFIDVKREQKSRSFSPNSYYSAMGGRSLNINKFTATNVPSLKYETMVPTMDNYRAKIAFEINELVNNYTKKTLNIGKDWNGVASLLMNEFLFGDQLKTKNKAIGEIVDKAMVLPAEKRVSFLFYHIRDGFVWNEKDGILTENGLDNLIKNKTGSVAEMNILLINTLKKSGFQAFPIVTRVAENGFLRIDRPGVSRLNYVIAAVVQDDGNLLLLDCTDKNNDPGYLPDRALAMFGLLIRSREDCEFITIENPNEGHLNQFIVGEIDSAFQLKGQSRSTFNGNKARLFREDYQELERKNSYVKALEDGNPMLGFSDIKVQDLAPESPKMIVDYNFEVTDEFDHSLEQLFISPLLFWQESLIKFSEDKREYPIFFKEYGTTKKSITIKYPEKLQVVSIPESVKMSLPDGLGSFTYLLSVTNNVISLQFMVTQPQAIIPPNHFEAYKNFLALIQEKQNEQIVFSIKSNN